jgi:hypothetical protein
MKKCTACGKKDAIFVVDDDLFLCQKCEDKREEYASEQYDRQREEGEV